MCGPSVASSFKIICDVICGPSVASSFSWYWSYYLYPRMVCLQQLQCSNSALIYKDLNEIPVFLSTLCSNTRVRMRESLVNWFSAGPRGEKEEKEKRTNTGNAPKHTQTTKRAHTHTRFCAIISVFFYYDNLGSDILTTSPVLGAQYDTVKWHVRFMLCR